MRRLGLVLIPLALVVAAGIGRAQEQLQPGTEGPLAIAGCDHPGVLYLPSDHLPGRRLPLIFFLHGSGGEPTSWPWRTATGGRGYIVCGLPYGAQKDAGAGGILSDPSSCAAMVEFMDEVRAQLDRDYGIDQDQVILSGLSMGGWGVNFYGFLEAAKDRYQAYAILAAGPRTDAGIDLGVAAGKRVLLLNGELDQNLAVANQGKPALEAAGAIVEQVILPGEGHVPSIASMTKPLADWLGLLRADLDRRRPAGAVAWLPLRLDDGEPEDRSPEALARFLAARPAVEKGREGRPALLFGVSAGKDRKDRPSRSASSSTKAEEELFCQPASGEIALAARSFACFRFELTGREKKAHPFLHEDSAPLVVLLDARGEFLAKLDGSRLRSKDLAAALRGQLDEEGNQAIDEKMTAHEPLLRELREIEKKRDRVLVSLDKMRAARKPPVTRIEKLETELAALEARRAELLADLAR